MPSSESNRNLGCSLPPSPFMPFHFQIMMLSLCSRTFSIVLYLQRRHNGARKIPPAFEGHRGWCRHWWTGDCDSAPQKRSFGRGWSGICCRPTALILTQVFEASEIKTEIGAGIGVQVNALRVLEHWGLPRENLKGVNYDGVCFLSNTCLGSSQGDARLRRLIPRLEKALLDAGYFQRWIRIGYVHLWLQMQF
jgi:hypothetical protein